MNIFIEIIGYLGMALVLCSFLMKDIKWVRIINICGAILSAVYGILTLTIPTAVLNGCLLIINLAFVISYIIKEKRNKDDQNKDKFN